MKTIGRDAAWLLVGCFLALAINESFGRGSNENDEQKWQRIEANKIARRAIEHKYEACMSQCRQQCK